MTTPLQTHLPLRLPRRALWIVASALAVWLAWGPAEAAEGEALDRNLKPEQEIANTVTVPQGELSVRLRVGNPQGIYSLGDTLDLSVETNKGAYVTVLNIGVDGTTTVLFPYLDGTDNLVGPDQPKRISGQGTGVLIRFEAPAGTDLVKAFASTEKVPLLDPAEITRVTPQVGRAHSSARNLVPEIQEVIDTTSAGMEWAIDTIKVTSVDGSVPVAVFEDAGQTVSVSEPFGLSLRTEKLVYGIGEPVQIAVTTARDCKLTLYNIGTSGAVRWIYPNAAQPEALIAAGTTVRIPADNTLLTSVGPAGVESLLALCTTDGVATLGDEGALIEQLFPKVGEWTALDARNLSVISTPQDTSLGLGVTARAVAAILVR